MYCPWDVSNYIQALTNNRNMEPKNYWENTSSNSDIIPHSILTPNNMSRIEYFKAERQKRGELGRKASG